jgi:hypothetical protein
MPTSTSIQMLQQARPQPENDVWYRFRVVVKPWFTGWGNLREHSKWADRCTHGYPTRTSWVSRESNDAENPLGFVVCHTLDEFPVYRPGTPRVHAAGKPRVAPQCTRPVNRDRRSRHTSVTLRENRECSRSEHRGETFRKIMNDPTKYLVWGG